MIHLFSKLFSWTLLPPKFQNPTEVWNEWTDLSVSAFIKPLQFFSSESFPTLLSYHSPFYDVILVTAPLRGPLQSEFLNPHRAFCIFPSLPHRAFSHRTFPPGRRTARRRVTVSIWKKWEGNSHRYTWLWNGNAFLPPQLITKYWGLNSQNGISLSEFLLQNDPPRNQSPLGRIKGEFILICVVNVKTLINNRYSLPNTSGIRDERKTSSLHHALHLTDLNTQRI